MVSFSMDGNEGLEYSSTHQKFYRHCMTKNSSRNNTEQYSGKKTRCWLIELGREKNTA